jgi:hypothetical protein
MFLLGRAAIAACHAAHVPAVYRTAGTPAPARPVPAVPPPIFWRAHCSDVVVTYVSVAFDWYFIGGPLAPYAALLTANTSFARLHGFPFELFGVGALLYAGHLPVVRTCRLAHCRTRGTAPSPLR